MTTVGPDGRKMLRLEVRNAQTPIEKKPSWIKTRAVMGPEYTALKSLVRAEGLHTVCESAGCPNIFARVLIHSGLRSIGVSALRTSRRSSLRPSGTGADVLSGACVTRPTVRGSG